MTLPTPQTAPRPPAVFAVRLRVAADYSRDTIPVPAEQYWAVFGTRAEAEEHARRLHREFVRGPDPFSHPSGRDLFGERFEDLTSLPELAFRDWLVDLDVEPPEVIQPTDPEPYRSPDMTDREWRQEQARWAKRWAEWTPERRKHERDRHTAALTREAWKRWWERVVVDGTLTPDQLAHVWAGLNKVEFFEVVEVPAADPPPPAATTVYAVVHEHWEYDDWVYGGANDPLAAFGTRAAAEAELARRQRALGADGEFDNGGPNRLVVVELPFHAEG
ncbi:hypothetical protein [Urbifossiella limnaea]|uniref:Uncharacterized protein n=1 Tax=Urbifossiella limnaea TaxID=2528023 RepID=A0A517Y1V7_9BACT|nr:hypothetical protein [Urbifossiella limnaea]QDU23741.1 hypothetical protein ETAA1_57480 [Urbifossiella limnaea]